MRGRGRWISYEKTSAADSGWHVARLLVTQCLNGIDAHCPSRRDVACRQRGGEQHERGDSKEPRVVTVFVRAQKSLQQSRRSRRHYETERDSEERQDVSFLKHGASDVSVPGAERHTHTELTRALRDGM